MKEYYGTPLPPIDSETLPKKPYQKESQIVTDSNRKRRFHGAFTGGFSAGYWNTVGSEEGWQPRQFKSSRLNRADVQKQNPKEFMDEEDLTQFGIAPQKIFTRNEFNENNKRKTLIDIVFQPTKDRLAMETLRYLKWSDQKSIGSFKFCPSNMKFNNFTYDNHEFDGVYQYYSDPRTKTVGLGYNRSMEENTTRLFKKPGSNLSKPRGQAFGVGVFEEEEADIYEENDMSNYCFYEESELITNHEPTLESKQTELLSGFTKASIVLNLKDKHKTKSKLPPDFTPTNFNSLKKSVPIQKPEAIEPVVEVKKEPHNQIIPVPTSTTDYKKPLHTDAVIKKPATEVIPLNIFEKRFVTSTTTSLDSAEKSDKKVSTIVHRRLIVDWYPSPELCKNFNVFVNTKRKVEQRKNENLFKNLVFETSFNAPTSNLPKTFSPYSKKTSEKEVLKKNENTDDSTKPTKQLYESAMMQPFCLNSDSKKLNLFDSFFQTENNPIENEHIETKVKHTFIDEKTRHSYAKPSSSEIEKPVEYKHDTIEDKLNVQKYLEKFITKKIITEEWVDKKSIVSKGVSKKKSSKKSKKSKHKKHSRKKKSNKKD